MFSKINLLILIVLFFISFCTKKSEKTKPVISDITESVYASATVKAHDQYQVFPKVSGILKEIKVKPGASVKKGDVLFILDNTIAALNTENTKLNYEQSKKDNSRNSEKLRQMQLSVKLSGEQYLLDSALYSRQKKLWDQKIGSQLTYEERRIAFINSRSSYQSQLIQLIQLQTQLRNDLDRNEINYTITREQQSDYLIRSNISGKVFDILPDKGELVSPQSPLAVLGRSEDFILEMKVDENDIALIRQGQRVEIIMDSYKGKVFEGIVSNIYPIMDERSRTFKVDARFMQPPPALYPNLTAEVNIIIQSKQNALIIPRTYLEDQRYVRISKNEKKEVVTGLQDYQKVEIIRGLDTSQTIYKPE